MKYIKYFKESYEWNKITIEDVFKLIDYADYINLYPGYEEKDEDEIAFDWQEYKFESKEQAYQFANEILDIFNNFPNEIEIYRTINVKSEQDIDMEYLGDCWSFNRRSAINFASYQGKGNYYLLTAKIKAEDVNWIESIRCYLHFSGNESDEDENELNVNGFKVYDIKIEKVNFKNK